MRSRDFDESANTMDPTVQNPDIQESDTRYRGFAVAITGDDGICGAICKLVPTVDSPDALHDVTKCASGVDNAGK